MRHCVLILLCLCFGTLLYAQSGDSVFSMSLTKQGAFLKAVNERFGKLDKQLGASSVKALHRVRKQEEKLYRKLYRKDSAAAGRLRAESQRSYAAMEHKLLPSPDSTTQKQLKEYLPALDSAQMGIAFLEQHLKPGDPLLKEVQAAKKTLSQYGSRMQGANEVKRALKERKRMLTRQLQNSGYNKELRRINKQMFYYQEQVKELKGLVKDRKRIENKIMAALRNDERFKAFMQKNSMLAQLFRVPANYGSAESLAGLQTSSSVAAMLQQRFAGAGINPREYMQQQVTQAQAQLNSLKQKIKRTGGGNSSDIDMPEGFKPNTQKSKSLLSRLEFGANFQTQRPHGLLPVTSDLGLTVGYKLNDKSVIGIGASYKLGWGNGIEHIQLSSEGAGLRSFIDWKVKGSLWITGGYEQNYYQGFRSFQALYDVSAWKQSALVGLTKKVKVKKDKTSKVQLLYDFFYRRNNIRTQPVMFRVEYGF